MPRKGKRTGELGRALVRDKFGGSKKRLADNPTNALHVMDENPDIAKDLKLRSVVEMNDLTELLTMAELADRDFTAEKQGSHVVFVGGPQAIGVNKPPLPAEQSLLPIPKRPAWTEDLTASQVDNNERESFVEWRRSLAQLEEAYDIVMTPFEKNLEVWRQLWRVTERSDLVVQILDARNPLLYRCLDLERYVKELGSHKRVMLVLNKADLLPVSYREHWAEFWNRHGVDFVFFSAVIEQEKLELEKLKGEGEEDDGSGSDEEEEESGSEADGDAAAGAAAGSVPREEEEVVVAKEEEIPRNTSAILGSEQLLTILTQVATECFQIGPFAESQPDVCSGNTIRPTVGFVGFPNVGKSSTLNVLCGTRRVGVGPTPGKTKHFQTILLDNGITMCDCPGLVFPSVVTSKGEMVCGGVLPIDQLRNHVEPVQLVASRIPREILASFYGITFPPPDPDHPLLTAADLLQAHAFARGFMTHHGAPDEARSARIILKDYVHGRLAFALLPPNGEASLINDMHALMKSRFVRNEATLTATGKDKKALAKPTAARFLDRDAVAYGENAGNVAAFIAGGKKKRPVKQRSAPNRAEKAWARAEASGVSYRGVGAGPGGSFTRAQLPLGVRTPYGQVPDKLVLRE